MAKRVVITNLDTIKEIWGYDLRDSVYYRMKGDIVVFPSVKVFKQLFPIKSKIVMNNVLCAEGDKAMSFGYVSSAHYDTKTGMMKY